MGGLGEGRFLLNHGRNNRDPVPICSAERAIRTQNGRRGDKQSGLQSTGVLLVVAMRILRNNGCGYYRPGGGPWQRPVPGEAARLLE